MKLAAVCLVIEEVAQYEGSRIAAQLTLAVQVLNIPSKKGVIKAAHELLDTFVLRGPRGSKGIEFIVKNSSKRRGPEDSR